MKWIYDYDISSFNLASEITHIFWQKNEIEYIHTYIGNQKYSIIIDLRISKWIF